MKKLFLLVSLNFSVVFLYATSDTLYPEVGKPCPEFVLKNVNYYNKKQVTLSDFKGKWLVLDFWTKYCSACVESFPETNAMQRKFRDRVQFMLVGIQDPEKQIKTMYERFQSRLNLKLPCAFDSSLASYWGIYNTPHIIVIDDKGIVQARTYGLDSADIETLLKGGHPALSVIPYVAQRKDAPDIGEQTIPYDDKKPYMVNGNGSNSGTNFLFRSVLTKWNQANQHTANPVDIDLHSVSSSYPKGMFQALGQSLRQLYLYAYVGTNSWYQNDTLFYGKYSQKLILEISDSSLFQTNAEGKNIFCYSLILPPEKGTRENLQKAMQRDLQTYFNFDASIETHKVPCWRLMAVENPIKKLSTKGGKSRFEEIIPHVSYIFSNMPMRTFVQYLGQFVDQQVIIDDTGIVGNIDITTDCLDFDSMMAFLPKYGLKLVPIEKEMKVLVIHDAKKP